MIVAVILGVTLTGGSDKPNPPGPKPGPVPPTPNPPVPINEGFNPYYLNDSSLIMLSKNKVSGHLFWNDTMIPTKPTRYGGVFQNISLVPEHIPHGINNNYTEKMTYDFSQVDYKITKVMFTDVAKTRY